MSSFRRARSWALRGWRLLLLATVVWLIRAEVHEQEVLGASATLTAERVRDFFPAAAALGELNPAHGWHAVLDAAGKTVGSVATTFPESSSMIGYSGPTNCLVAFDVEGAVMGTRILKSHDTSDHVAEVIADRKFFTQFRGLKSGVLPPGPLHTVSGATLTSAAIAQGVLAKLGQVSGASLRFPEAITLEEVRLLDPAAVKLRASSKPDFQEVLDAQESVIGLAVRTSPITDTLVGYKGPTDTLMLLDPAGKTLRRMAVRKSYDTKRYVAYVTGDAYFLNLFNGMALEKLSTLDFDTTFSLGSTGGAGSAGLPSFVGLLG